MMKAEEKAVWKEAEGREMTCVEVWSGEQRLRLCVSTAAGSEEAVLQLRDADSCLQLWPLSSVRLVTDAPGGGVAIEVGNETRRWSCGEDARALLVRTLGGVAPTGISDAALGALLADAADDDAEQWVRRLADRLARLDAANVGGMLGAASEGGGARLAARLEAAACAADALAARRARYSALTRAAPDAAHARSGAARAEHNARALLSELRELYAWLEAPGLGAPEALSELSLASAEGRARARVAAEALGAALRRARAEGAARKRLGAVRERLRRLERARDSLAAALARHLNNLLIHVGNEAASNKHHAELLPYAPFVRALKEMDEKAHEGLMKVYIGTWARVYERELRAACDAARAALATSTPDKTDAILDNVLVMVETMCNSEQDFCMQFFHLDIDVKSEPSECIEPARRSGAEARRLAGELFPTLEPQLVALVQHIERADPYGAMRALACVSRRVLGGGAGDGGASGEGRWARGALAAAAVAAKRGADRFIQEKIAALPDGVKQASKKTKCGILPFLAEFEEVSRTLSGIFSAGGRRADVERWLAALAGAALAAVAGASHPRTPRAALRAENYHRLHAALSTLRLPALEPLRRECRTRYTDALKHYVTQYFGTPLEKLTQFFEGVAEAVAAGVREEEVGYRAACSKHELRRLLALYPPREVRASLHRLYRSVDRHLCEEAGLLQVVWRAMQEELLAQHHALQARITACYPGSGLSMPLTTQDILDAFSDIAREH